MEHYVPSGWSIEIHGMPQIAIDALDVIRFLAVDTHTYIHLNQTQIKRIKSCIFQSKKFLKNTKLYQEARHAKKPGITMPCTGSPGKLAPGDGRVRAQWDIKKIVMTWKRKEQIS
jgi:hypothetical protein